MDTTQIGQQNFTLPHDVVKLPTGGIFYKSKKKAVKVGFLTAADENLLMAGDSGNKDGLIITLLKNKIYEPDLRPDELLDGDIQAILIFLRNTAFGPEYEFNLIDPETNKEFSTKILLEELNIKKTNEVADESGYFSTVLPKSGFNVKLRPINYAEQNEIDKMGENYPAGRIPPKQTWKLNKMVHEIDGNVDRSFIVQTIETLPISDAKYIRRFIEENEPKLDLVRTVIAPSGKEVIVTIAFGVEFFRPFF
jgi:hypothetical protein